MIGDMKKLITFGLFAALVISSGCSTSTHTKAATPAIQPTVARLTQEQAISLATFTAERNGYLLSNYKAPDVFREVHYGWRTQFIYWHVTFESKFSLPDGFNVMIDDQSHKVTLTQIEIQQPPIFYPLGLPFVNPATGQPM